MNDKYACEADFSKSLAFSCLLGIVFGVLMNVFISIIDLKEIFSIKSNISPSLVQGLALFLCWLLFMVLCSLIFNVGAYDLGRKVISIFMPTFTFVIAWGLWPVFMYTVGKLAGRSPVWDPGLTDTMQIGLPIAFLLTALVMTGACFSRDYIILLLRKTTLLLPDWLKKVLAGFFGNDA